jgi:hypothetical protein
MRLPRVRLRFSIRWLLVLIAASATLCYVLFVRPTVVAHRFVNAVAAGDYETVESLLGHRLVVLKTDSQLIDRVYAEVLPREWNDIWSLRRRLLVRVSLYEDKDGRHIEWTEDINLAAHINGVIITPVFDPNDPLFGDPF